VRAKPAGVVERDLTRTLAAGWGIRAVSAEFAAVGGGSYHWVVRDGGGEQYFVTVDDLDVKSWLGESRSAAFVGLLAAMDTALALRIRAGLQFVVAPIPALRGQTLRPLGAQYAVAVFPYLSGAAGRFGEVGTARERVEVVDMLAALHRSTPLAAGAMLCPLSPARRGTLETAMTELRQPWRGGPLAEAARSLLAEGAGQIRRLLATFDRLADRVTAARREPVITHGEPHPANLIRAGADRLLVDWDTVGLALPERDLWMVTGKGGEEADLYTAATGRPVDPAALAFYELRWAVDDICSFVRRLRSEHSSNPDTEHAYLSLKTTIENADRIACGRSSRS
jgi:spectinomycin phosphotransferase